MPRTWAWAAASLAVCFLAIASPARAGKVKVWHHQASSHFEKAKFRQAVVSSEGALRLSRQLKPLAGVEAAHVWDVIEDKDGNLYAATGGERGRVFKIAADGKVTTVYTTEAGQVFCLALGDGGAVYAGTGPTGQIVRIDAKGQAKVHCATSESYVWSLAVDAKTGTLFAGTGPKGRIYRANADGKAVLFHQTKQEHILCLTLAADGTLYAGTDKGGLVYRFDVKGKPFVLFQAAQAEVKAIRLVGDALYVATSAPTRKRTGTSSASISAHGADFALAKADGDVGRATSDRNPAASGPRLSGESRETARANAAPAPSVPAAGDNSVYRIAADGTVREVFREKALLLSLLRWNGLFYVGSGMEGQLFQFNEATREHGEAARLDHGQILALCRRGDDSLVLGTGDPGRLYLLENRFAAKGTIVSEVLDAKLLSRWGALRWQADMPAGTTATVAVRSGNVADPDDSWSDWSAEQTDGAKAAIDAPAARFLQYRVSLATTNPAASPALHDLTLRYQTANLAPEVTKVEVPDLNAVNLDNPKKLKFKWTATDPTRTT